MAKPQLSGLFVLGIDLGNATQSCADAHRQSRAVERLCAELRSRQIAATWTVPRMASWETGLYAETLAQIRAAQTAHEVGLHWDGPSLDSPTDVFTFRAALREQVSKASQFGIRLQTLCVDGRKSVPYIAVAKSGFRTLRPVFHEAPLQRTRVVHPQALRHGLWGVPVSHFWSDRTRLLRKLGQRKLLYQTQLASQNQGILHLVIDFAAVARAEAQPSDLLRYLDRVAQLRDGGELQVARLADIHQMVRAATRAVRRRGSILKAVA